MSKPIKPFLTYEQQINLLMDTIVYQRRTYGNVPLWVAMKAMTLGQTSKMYSLLDSSVKTKISHHFACVSELDLAMYLRLLTHFNGSRYLAYELHGLGIFNNSDISALGR